MWLFGGGDFQCRRHCLVSFYLDAFQRIFTTMFGHYESIARLVRSCMPCVYSTSFFLCVFRIPCSGLQLPDMSDG